MIGAAVGVDDQVRHDVGAGRLDENMNAPRHTGAAQRVADDPADRIAGGDWSGSDELFAFLERDVGDLPRGCINLEQRAVGPGIFLDRVEKCSTVRLDARRVIGPADLHLDVGGRGNRGKCERSEEHTSELQSLMRISYAVFCLKKKKHKTNK